MSAEDARQAMADLDLSFRDLAFLTGYDPGYLCHIAKGRRVASRTAALRIAKALGISPYLVPSNPLPVREQDSSTSARKRTLRQGRRTAVEQLR